MIKNNIKVNFLMKILKFKDHYLLHMYYQLTAVFLLILTTKPLFLRTVMKELKTQITYMRFKSTFLNNVVWGNTMIISFNFIFLIFNSLK